MPITATTRNVRASGTIFRFRVEMRWVRARVLVILAGVVTGARATICQSADNACKNIASSQINIEFSKI